MSSTNGGGDSSDPARRRSISDKIKHPFPELREKLKDTHLYDVKVKAVHTKHGLGKMGNLFNRNHRHDEEHEKATDDKRTRISESHRFQSFAPEHDSNNVKWYVDGRDYFWAVSIALERAKETIYIADWWLSPELFLRRPPHENKDWRLDRILKRRAEAGVQIYVNVYKEVSAALTCNSEHTKNALRDLCPEGTPGYGNIHVMRHPDHNTFSKGGDMTLYFAHHEKFIVIDYETAFIGGLDLCFGRWDNHQHVLADAHPAGVKEEIFPGQDFNNNRIMDFQGVEDWKSNELSKVEYGRMPWHDISMGLIGDCVYDIAEHFVMRWNFTKRDKYKRDKRFDWLQMEGREQDEDLIAVQRPKYPVGKYLKHPLTPLSSKPRGNQGTIQAQIVRSTADWSGGILTEHSIQNAYCELIRNAQHFVYIENQFFITATGDEQTPICNQIGRAIVDACVRAGKEERKFRIIILIPAIPGFAGDLRDDAAKGTRAIMEYQYKSINRGEHSIMEQIRSQGVDPAQHIFFFNLRAFDRLNKTPAVEKMEEQSGVKYKEAQRAGAEELMGAGMDRKNDIGSDNHPGTKQQGKKFEETRQDSGVGNSEEPPSKDTVAQDAMLTDEKPSKEVMTGNEDKERENYVQEELYIHSKLLIVDDRIAVCGSSNINDRSQRGDHDSELAIVMQDTRKLPSTMDGTPFEASYHAATLRRYLWREHLGLLKEQPHDASSDINAQPPSDSPNDPKDSTPEYEFVEDPLSDKLWETWTSQATRNTEIFRQLFHADPDDHVVDFETYEKFLPKKVVKAGHVWDPFMPVDDLRAKLDEIKGHLVWFPLEFLRDAEMAETGLQVNSVTESIYT
ncbi:MAG: hypothetical protein M1814_006395 [Vezdaea aestivalis]|nr:MAG: hypothetical protein M1814_006395 [Vezdaea aestivalis]